MDTSSKGTVTVDNLELLGDFDNEGNIDETRKKRHSTAFS